jgi:RNA polymerase sigma-70 factor (ECF subfamily)
MTMLETPIQLKIFQATLPEKNLSAAEFQELSMQHMDTLYRVALRLTGDAASAEDLVQETYLRALRAWKTFHLHEFGIRPWLLRIMKNVHLSAVEHDRVRPRALDDRCLDRVSGKADHSIPLSSSDPRLFDAIGQGLARALASLPKHYQLVLLLWAVDGLSYLEIASALKVPMGTVMSRLHRARSRLVERLGGARIDIA